MIKATTRDGKEITIHARNLTEFNRQYESLLAQGAKIRFSRLP